MGRSASGAATRIESSAIAPKHATTFFPTESSPISDVTQLLIDWNEGDEHALDALMPRVVDELRRVARGYLRGEGGSHTLQPTALVNEVYLRLIDRERVDWQDRAHFFAFAARTMRRILVDHARARRAAKRGHGEEPVTLLDTPVSEAGSDPVDILALDLALEKLAALDEKQARVVELRYFAGLTVNETAEVTGMARATVTRYWTLAKAFLYRELTRE